MNTQEIKVFTTESEINRHTEDMQEIITKVPSWILRWGITVFFGILLMVVAISIFVRYPDTIKTGLRLVSSEVSAPVITTEPDRVVKLFVKQGAIVKKGQPLADIQTLSDPVREYSLNAPQDGKVGFAAIVQSGSLLGRNEEVFYIHPQNEYFFGIMEIPSNNINKIKIGQQVLVSLRNYPADEYGRLKGTISYIADEPGKEGFFALKVTLNTSDLKRQVQLKNWMIGDAEIITQDVSILKRISLNLFKFIK